MVLSISVSFINPIPADLEFCNPFDASLYQLNTVPKILLVGV